jgi:excisionase family DNA binding protein
MTDPSEILSPGRFLCTRAIERQRQNPPPCDGKGAELRSAPARVGLQDFPNYQHATEREKTMKSGPPVKYADVWQAAEYLHVSIPCIRKWLSTGKLTRYRAGRRVLVKISDLEAMVVADPPEDGEVTA